MNESKQWQSMAVVSNSKPDNELVSKYSQYILENPIKSATTAILSWGGLLLLMFFLRIGFLPDVSLESMSSLLYAVALFGGFIAAYSALLMVLPGLAMAQFRGSMKFVRSHHLWVIATFAALNLAAFITHLFNYCAMWVVAATFCVLLIVAPLYCVVLDIKKRYLSLVMGSRAHLKSTQISNGTLCSRCLENHKWRCIAQYSQKLKIYFPVILLCLRRRPSIYLWIFFMVFSTTILFVVPLMFIGTIGLTGDIRTASEFQSMVILIALITLIAMSSAYIGYIKKSNHRIVVAAVFGPTLLFFVLLLTGNFSAFSVIAVKSLGLGEINTARITVLGKTCKEINQTLGQRVCVDVPDQDVTAICPVRIRSRIGSQVLLEFAPMIIETESEWEVRALWTLSADSPSSTKNTNYQQTLIRRVVLEKSKMLGWQPLQNFGEKSSEHSFNSTILPMASFIEHTKTQADNDSSPTKVDTLNQILRIRCGEEYFEQQDISTGKASDSSQMAPH